MLAQRKYLYDLSLPEKRENRKSQSNFKLIKNSNKNNLHQKNKARLVLTVLTVFSMFMIITYRYNIISEKNLHVQELKEDLEMAKSELATTQIAVDKVMDVNYIESYAKQQLGMQKPEKSQLVYINMENADSVQKISAANMISNLFSKLKNVF